MSPDVIVATARGWIGTPYRHLAARRGAGCDCLGLVRGVWADLYGIAPDVPAYRADRRDLRDLLAEAERRLDACEPGRAPSPCSGSGRDRATAPSSSRQTASSMRRSRSAWSRPT